MTTRSLASLLVAVILVPVLSADESGWEKFTSKEGRFSVLFPGKPKQKEHKPTNESVLKDVRFTAEHDGISYTVGYIDYAPKLVDRIKNLGIAAFMKRHREITVKNSAGKVVDQKELTLGKAKHPGYELLVQTPQGFLRQRVFYVEGRLYQTFAAGTRDKVTGARGNQFHSSLRLSE